MTQLNVPLDDVLKYNSATPARSAIGDALKGINHRMQRAPLPAHLDSYGIVFFTRPMLNLTHINLSRDRKFIPYLSEDPYSTARWARCTLDPRRMYKDPSYTTDILRCPLVDNELVFIPALTNLLTTLTGWPDTTLDMYTTKEGVYKEQVSYVDSGYENYGKFTLTATFRNVLGDYIEKLFQLWTMYSAKVFQGDVLPYEDLCIQNVIDYQSRIYVLVLDKNRHFVTKIAYTGICSPETNPNGGSFDYSSEEPLNQNSKDFSISFNCSGAVYNDPLSVRNFNHAVTMFQPEMSPTRINKGFMRQVHPKHLKLFNNMCYPRIDPLTMELMWFVQPNIYNAIVLGYNNYADKMGMLRI
jgi:hypothetical protein